MANHRKSIIFIGFLLAVLICLVSVRDVYGRSYPGYYIIKMKTNRNVQEILNELLQDRLQETSIRSSGPLFINPTEIQQTRSALHKQVGLNRISFCEIDTDLEPADLLAMLEDHPDIAYAIENHIYRTHQMSPDDSLFHRQWYLRQINIEQAWTLTRGSENVLVAIVDTGIDYDHLDLSSRIWINRGEDVNGDGMADATDFNDIDDDRNGFVDDIMGWDFTDAPHFPDDGDYLDRDNDPFDEYGHGTSVAGVIAAVSNNWIGISGIAPQCRIMNVRAGTAQGLLEEDDVASAIVYAVDNGAQIINMSFGDTYASPLLQDVIQYAHEANCVLIASAGNSGNADIQYPSGYSQTISVASTDETNQRASFSNYGTTIDLVAPGINILTTTPQNRYDEFSGTSASAPIVSGIAALILSLRGTLTNEMVRSILVASAEDLGHSGRDDQFGAGLTNAYLALKMDVISRARIITPILDQGFSGDQISVIGDAFGAHMDSYRLLYGISDNPIDWIMFAEMAERQTVAGLLGEWNVRGLPDTTYTIRLKVINKDGNSIEDMVRIFIDRTYPRIFNVRTTDMVDGTDPGTLIQFETDDLCECSIFYRRLSSGDQFEEIKLPYRTNRHRFFFTTDYGWDELEFYIDAVNNAGLSNKSPEFYSIDLRQSSISTASFIESELSLPAGYMLNFIADFDEDGFPEVVLNKFDANYRYDDLSVYEYHCEGMIELFHSERLLIPRDIGDSDNDGFLEILAGAGPASYILEATKSNPVPNMIVWRDSNDVWASRFADLDGDGAQEVICRIGSDYHILENVGDNTYQDVATLKNFTEGDNGVGVPHVEYGDYDNDGFMNLLFGDYDGDLIMYENKGENYYVESWSQRQPLMDCIDYLASGDFDGDGIIEFAAGCHSNPDINAEHEYDARHWIYLIYDCDGDDAFSSCWEQAFWGYDSPRRPANGISAGDVDNDGLPELVINVFPDLYIIDYDLDRRNYQTSWYWSPNYSQANIIGDIDRDGLNDIFVFDGQAIRAFHHASDIASLLPAPFGFSVAPLDTNAVRLQWHTMIGANGYKIYKGRSGGQLNFLTTVPITEFTDYQVCKDSLYWYAVSAYNVRAEDGLMTAVRSVRPGYRPYVKKVDYFVPNQVKIEFSEMMNSSIKNAVNYWISPDVGYPRSVIVSRSSSEVILTIDMPFLSSASYRIRVDDVYDSDGTPIDTIRNSAQFTIPVLAAAPYIISAILIDDRTIEIEFNQRLEKKSAETISNYKIMPTVEIVSADLLADNETTVRLTLSEERGMRALGMNYILTVCNVKNLDGIAIREGEGDQKAFSFVSQDLSDVYTYPNPYKIGDGTGIMFANLTSEATISIYMIDGSFVRKIRESDGNGGVEWDVKDEHGNDVSSGVYIYYVESDDDTHVGKFVIIR